MPIPVTSENWETIRRLYAYVYENTQPTIAAAINRIYEIVTVQYSLDSKPGLRKLITDLLDPSFISWLVEMGCKPKSFVFYLENNLELNSEIQYSAISPFEVSNFPELKVDCVLDLSRINRGWMSRKYPDYPHLNMLDEVMISARCSSAESFNKAIELQKLSMESDIDLNCATASSLKNFFHVCNFLSPKKIKVVEIARTDNGENYLPKNLTANRRRTRKSVKSSTLNNSKRAFTFTIFQLYDVSGICLACDLHTEEISARNQLISSSNILNIDKQQLKEAGEVKHKKGYSQLYCMLHSDITNRAGNSKALRDRPYFLTLLAAMDCFELRNRIDADLICKENWRRFAALATENRACRKHLRKILNLTPNLMSKDFDRICKKATSSEIYDQVVAIYTILGITPEQAEPFNPSHIDFSKKALEISNGPLGGTIEGTKMIHALTASRLKVTKMPNLKDRKIKTPRKSRPFKLRASVPPTAPAP